MALLSLITGQKQHRTELKGQDNEARVLLIDVTTLRTPTHAAEITTSPVEEGPDVSDHYRPKPVTIQIEGIVSETPLTLTDSLQGLATSAGGITGSFAGGFAGAAAAVGGSFVGARLLQSSGSAAEVARKYLEDLITNKTLFTVTTKSRKYDNMMITSLTFPEDTSTAGQLKFSASAQQVIIVKTESVLISKISKTAAHSAAAKSKQGKQTPEPQAAEAAKKSSLLYKGFSFLTGG